MSDQPVRTYTIGAHPLHSSPCDTQYLELPPNGDNIRIVVSESIPTMNDRPDRIHFIQPNPTNTALTRTKAPAMISTTEIVEVPPSDKTDISRGYQMASNNTFITNQANTQNGFSNSDRYLETPIY
jgi:hypothetical protein